MGGFNRGVMNTTSEHETRPTHPHYRADRPRHRSQRRGKEGHGSPPMPGGSKESIRAFFKVRSEAWYLPCVRKKLWTSKRNMEKILAVRFPADSA